MVVREKEGIDHMPFHYPKKKKIENQIKENKENKNKIKIKY